jgi:hypothetical protein
MRLGLLVLMLQAASSINGYFAWAGDAVTRSRHQASLTTSMEAVRDLSRKGPVYLLLPQEPGPELARADFKLLYLFYFHGVTHQEQRGAFPYNLTGIRNFKALPPECTPPSCNVVVFKQAEQVLSPSEMHALLAMLQQAGMQMRRGTDMLLFSY